MIGHSTYTGFFFFTLLAHFSTAVSAQPQQPSEVVADALRFVDRPCTAPDQNPVCWAKTWIACFDLDKKYCPLIGIDSAEGFSLPVKPKNSADDDDSWLSPYENRLARGPLKEDPWTLTHENLSELVEEEYASVTFHDFVSVTSDRFKSQWEIPQRLRGDYELRIASYVGPETDTIARSFFFRFENMKWKLVSEHSWFMGGSSGRFSPDTCDYGENCNDWLRGLAPWPDLQERNDE
jgi:hypothetical protein